MEREFVQCYFSQVQSDCYKHWHHVNLQLHTVHRCTFTVQSFLGQVRSGHIQ